LRFERQIAQQPFEYTQRAAMCDDEPTQWATQLFDDGPQALGDVREALALRRPEIYGIAPSLREPRGIGGLQRLQRLAFPRAEIDFAQCGFNFELRLRRDDLARLQAASHRTDQTPLKIEGVELDLNLQALCDA
jgi:hypothetical protein